MPSYINPTKLFTDSVIPRWLLMQPDVSPGAKLAYARLLNFASNDGPASPNLELLSSEIGISRRQTMRYLKELVNHGLIESVRRGLGKTNIYHFPVHEWMRTGVVS